MIRIAIPLLGLALAASALAQGDLSQIRTLEQQAKNAYPKNSWNIDQTLWSQAARAAEQAVQTGPTNQDALLLRAQIYTEVGFWARAQSAWNAYFQVGGTSPEARQGAAETQYNLGFAAYKQGQLSAAREAFATCLSYANDARCAAWAGRVELESGNPGKAAELYGLAVQYDPGDKTSQYFLDLAGRASTYGQAATAAFTSGYRAFEAGDKAAAYTDFVRAAQLAPNFTEAQRFVGRLATELGQGGVARSAYEAVAGQPGATAADRYNLDYAREVDQYGAEAVKTYRDAYAAYARGDRAAAEGGFLAATAANGYYQKAWAWLGRTRFERGNYAGAAQAYQQAVTLDPSDQASAYFLSQAQKKQ